MYLNKKIDIYLCKKLLSQMQIIDPVQSYFAIHPNIVFQQQGFTKIWITNQKVQLSFNTERLAPPFELRDETSG